MSFSLLSATLATLVAGAQGARSAAPQDAPGVRFHSQRLGVQSGPDGSRSLVVLRDGAVLRSLALGNERVVLGSQLVALVGREPSGGERRLRLYDGGLEALAETRIPEARHAVAGLRGVALVPRSEHLSGSVLDIDFLDRLARPLGKHAQDDRRLATLESLPDGSWVVVCTDRFGEFHVQSLDERGRFRWEHATRSRVQPIVATTSAGKRTAIGFLGDDLTTSRLVLVDGAGRVRASARVPAFHLARFSPDGGSLALLGRDTLVLVSTADAALRWTRSPQGVHVTGAALAFSTDGLELATVSQDQNERGAPAALSLNRYRRLGGQPRVRHTGLDSIPVSPNTFLVELSREPGAAWRLVTRTGSWSIDS